jgi:hypothetical protein
VGLIDRLPEHLKSRRTAQAVTAPSAILLAGAGAAIGILGGIPIVAAAVVGALAYGIRVATMLPRQKRGSRIDPMAISDPWRGFVREALDAQRRYAKAVRSAQTGPLRDRLTEIGARIDAGVQECWRIARRGDALVDAIGNLGGGETIADELQRAKQAAKATPGKAQDDTVEAIQAQADSYDRLVGVARTAQERLQVLNARLDEAVARAVELAITAEDVGELQGLGGDVESLVGEMETLRQGLEEAGGTAQAAGAAG